MPSALYSSCSSTNMWRLKYCCSFSWVQLMHRCSTLLSCKRRKRARERESPDAGPAASPRYLEDLKPGDVEDADEVPAG